MNFTVLGCGNTNNNGDPSAEDGVQMDGTDGTTSPTSDGTGDSTGSGGANTGSTGDATGSSSTTGTLTGGCMPGIPTTSQVPRLLNREYDTIVHDLLGVSSLASADNQPPSSLLQPDFDGELTSNAWQGYLEAGSQVAAEVMAGENRSRFMDCDPTAVASCYDDTVRAFGRKMFRRPLTDEEVARFMAFTDTDPSWTPEQISEAILFGFLVAPSFIMVPELSATTEDSAFKLSSYEVATRLSLMLWGSVADEELNAAADQDSLTTTDQIRAQAERMILLRDKAAPRLSAAHAYYVGSASGATHWWIVDHDPELFPNYTADTRVALQGEFAAFFEDVAYEGGSFQDIFLSNVAFVNQDNAAIYGLDPDDYGTDLTRVELDETERPGIFTRAGFLSSYSSYDATNPILRGAFFARNVLGVDPGPPPPDVSPPQLPGDFTTRREQVEALTSAQASCAACHNLLNPAGFVLEHFDAVGSWQDVDRLGGDIDSTADVTFSDGSVTTISTPLELMQAVAADPVARHLYTEQLVAFFTGRSPNASDACLVDGIANKLADDGYTMLDLVIDLTQADSFRLRATSN